MAPEPASAPEPQPAPVSEVPEEAPETVDPGAHGPSFAPNVDDTEAPAEAENTEPPQSFMDDDRDAPIPHLDDEAEVESGGAADGETQPGRVNDPDPVSPATQAAILDAQSTMDDDDGNPSGG